MLNKIHIALLLMATALPHVGYTVPKVVATINPIQFLVSDVGRGILDSNIHTLGTSCVHDCVLKPSDVASLNSADIVFYVDERMEPYIKKLRGPGKALIRLSDEVELLPDRSTKRANGSSNNVNDFHIWLNPDNAKKIVEKICSVLSDADPENAQIYRSNADSTIAGIDALKLKVHDLLEPVKNVPYIVAHDAYQYFDSYFGLNFKASLTAGHTLHTTARELSFAKKTAKKFGVKCIFVSGTKNSYRLISKHMKITVVDPIGKSIVNNKNGYAKLIEELATQFQRCLEKTDYKE